MSLLLRWILIVLLTSLVKVHYVFLSWVPSVGATSGLTYSIYRVVSAQPCPAPGTPPYQLLTKGLWYKAAEYIDHAVLSGYSYCYIVYAVYKGQMSSPAGPVGATVP